MLLKIRHMTQYDYDAPVSYALQKLRLTPQRSILQEVKSWGIAIEGGRIETSYTDQYGNFVSLVSAKPGTRRLKITAEGAVHTHDTSGVLGQIYGIAPLWHFVQTTPLTKAGKRIEALAQVVGEADTLLSGLHALSSAVLKAVPYEIGATVAGTTAEEAVAIGKGVCQDHSGIFIAAARSLGLPARYVSGYLMMDDRTDQDASHAWAEVHLDAIGWVGFDVSNGMSPDGRYVRTAVGRDAIDAAPISGLRMGSGNEAMIVSLQVQQ